MDEKSSNVAEISLRDYIDLLRRRKAILIQTFVVVFVIGAIVTYMAKPVFRTSARILVEGKSNAIAAYAPGDPLSAISMLDQGHDVATQLEILQGSELMQKAFQDSGVPPGSVALDVKEVGNTDVIELTAQSGNPDYAARFANTLPTTYMKFFTRNRSNELDSAIDFARKRLDEETVKVREAEQKLEVIRKKTLVVTTKDEQERRMKDKNLADIEVQSLSAAISGDETRLTTMVSERNKLPDYVKTPVVVTNAAVDSLKEKITDLEGELASMQLRYNSAHPRVREQEALIADAKVRLARAERATQTHVSTHNPAKEAADKAIADLRATLASNKILLIKARQHELEATQHLIAFGNGEPTQTKLENDAAKARNLVTMLTKDVDDLLIRRKGEHNPITIVTPAASATEVAPRSAKNLLYPTIIGLVLGFCFALLQEFLDDRVNSPEDARRLMDAPTLGYVPLVEAPEMRLLSRTRNSGAHTTSFSLLESYRVLRTNVQFAAVDNPKNSLLVTSTTPGEGKSVTAANLAVALALDGKRVILVDADLRRPTLHDKFGIPSRPGLTNVLVGQVSIEEGLQETEIPGLRLLVAGPLPPNPAELLNSQAMRQMHEDLKSLGDIVIFDSPPMLATADAQVLSASVDGVLYVVQFGEAKKSTVRHAMELLGQAHANVLGVIFNKIDLTTKRDDYYYGYYAYYQYYQTEKLTGQKRRRRSTEEFEALLSKFSGNGGSRLPNGLPSLPPQLQEPRTDEKAANGARDTEISKGKDKENV